MKKKFGFTKTKRHAELDSASRSLANTVKVVESRDPVSSTGRRKPAFTLAEVLITLGIIGVVAAITIPTLISKYQKQEYVTKLKKTYTQTNEVLKLMSAEMNCANDLKCTGLFDTTTTSQTLGTAIVKYFKVVKDCGIVKGQGCLTASTNNNYDGASATNTNYDNYSGFDFYNFITADGISFSIYNYSSNCGNNYSNGITNNMTQACGRVLVDINGPTKGPNVYGRDTFFFFITNGKGALLYPRGGADDRYVGSNNWWKDPDTKAPRNCYPNDKLGIYCTGRIMEENWEMNY